MDSRTLREFIVECVAEEEERLLAKTQPYVDVRDRFRCRGCAKVKAWVFMSPKKFGYCKMCVED